jgi:hypothetical protein
MTTIQIRQAIAEEIGWINERYDEVGFVHSDLTRDYVAIAEVDRSRAGLGRLVHSTKGLPNWAESLLCQSFVGKASLPP